MDNKLNLEMGMYIVDKEYRMLAINEVLDGWYPEAEVGELCYKTLAMQDSPCDVCPLKSGQAMFYSDARKEWVSASAAFIDLPEFGECYIVHSRRQVMTGSSKNERVSEEHITQFVEKLLGTATGRECIMASYCEPDSPLFYANEKMANLLGYLSVEEMTEAMSGLVVNFMHPDDCAQIKRDMKGRELRDKAFEVSYRMRKKDGSWIWVVSKGILVKTEDGRMVSFCVCEDMKMILQLQDVLLETNRELTQKEERNALFMNRIPGGYHRCGTDAGYTFEYISESFEKVVGWTAEEIEKEFDGKFLNMVWPEDRYLFDNLVEEIEDNGQGSSIYRMKKKGGGFRWVQDSTMLIEDGEDGFYQCSIADITNFVEKQEALVSQNVAYQQKEELFDNIALNMPSGYHRCGTTDGFRLTFVSDSFLEVVGWTREELEQELDNQFINIVAPEDREMFMELEPVLKRDGRIDAVYRIKRKDGKRRWIKDATTRVKQDGEIFYQCTLADITEYVEQLNLEKQKAEASSRAKSAFLFNASHDIRTPMNAIQGFTQILKKNLQDEKIVRETIEKIEKSSDTLGKLLNDVLELSRIESGKEEMNLMVTNLTDYATRIYNMFENEMEGARVSFEMTNEIQDDVVWCDELKITQIGMNMLSNAKKFTPAGGKVQFGIQQLSEKKDGCADYRFYVKDTGIGMSVEFQQRAFEQFERERTSTDSGVVGSGLGMAIIKKLVDLMGGTYTLESKLGEGTEIAAIINLRISEEQVMPSEGIAVEQVDFGGKRVLLVEDNAFNREIARFVLENMNFEVEEAEDGSVAVNMISNADASYYDLVLMDIQMPVLNGYQTTEIIRGMPDKKIAGIPIIAMTANAFQEDKDRCLEVGMDGHIAKPINDVALVNELSKVIAKSDS